MKLTLIILLLTGVATSAQNLRGVLDEMMLLKGSDAVRELKGDSTKNTPKSTRKKSSQCGPCNSDESCKKVNGSYTCVTKKTPKSRAGSGSDSSSDSSSGSSTSSDSTSSDSTSSDSSSPDRRRCAARVRSIAVVVSDDEDVKSCARKLRSNDSMTRYLNKNFHPKRIDDFEVVKVGDCSSNKVKNKLKELESNRRSNTNDKVKTVFVVVSKDDFSDDCKRAIKKLPEKIEEDLRCGQIRRMDDDQTDSDDNFIIRVKSESQCTTRKLEKEMLDAADLN
jgi:hypothetical protein